MAVFVAAVAAVPAVDVVGFEETEAAVLHFAAPVIAVNQTVKLKKETTERLPRQQQRIARHGIQLFQDVAVVVVAAAAAAVPDFVPVEAAGIAMHWLVRLLPLPVSTGSQIEGSSVAALVESQVVASAAVYSRSVAVAVFASRWSAAMLAQVH